MRLQNTLTTQYRLLTTHTLSVRTGRSIGYMGRDCRHMLDLVHSFYFCRTAAACISHSTRCMAFQMALATPRLTSSVMSKTLC